MSDQERLQDIAERLELAKKTEFPKFPGSQSSKYAKIRDRPESTYTEVEKKFLEYAEYVIDARHKYLSKKKSSQQTNDETIGVNTEDQAAHSSTLASDEVNPQDPGLSTNTVVSDNV